MARLIEKINLREFSQKEILDLLRQWRENNERRITEMKSIIAFYKFYDVKNINERRLVDRYVMCDHNEVVRFCYTTVFCSIKNEKISTIWRCAKALACFGSVKVLNNQMIFASLDIHAYGNASMDILRLSNIFPGSMRVIRLKAMELEAQEKYDEALEILDSIIKADETNAPARKRRIAVLKAQGLITEAIKELVDYLKKFMSDVEGWQQLCELYLQVGELSRAAFCSEELLLHQPHNNLLHQRAADIRYTMGGVENMELAKSYYCQALKLNPNNMRATLGLFLTTTNLLNHYKSSGNSSKRKEVWKLSQWAQTRASRRTAEAGNDAAAQLANVMLNLAITE